LIQHLASRSTFASGSPDLQVSLSDFAAHMNTSTETARQWIERFGLDAGNKRALLLFAFARAVR